MPKKKGKKLSKKEEEAAAAEEAERKRREAEEEAAAEVRALDEARREAEEQARREAEEKARRERPFSIVVRTRCLPFCLSPTLRPRDITLTVREVDKIAAVKQQLVALTRASHKVTVRRIVLAYPPARSASDSWDDMENDAALVDYGVALPRGVAIAADPIAILRLKLAELTEAELQPVGPAYADPWRYSARDQSLLRTAPRGSVFDLQRYQEEMEKQTAFVRTPTTVGADAEDELGGGSDSADVDDDDESDDESALAAPALPTNNHELLAALTLRTTALKEEHDKAEGVPASVSLLSAPPGESYNPVAALRGALTFQKRRKATAKLLR